jgi:putative ABC transport system permease protein
MGDILQIGIEIGLVYAPLALAAYISFTVLSLPDLTIEGAFGIGGAVCAVTLTHGVPAGLALVAGAAAGSLAGLTTALLHNVLRFNVLLASLMVTTAAWSVSFMIMGGDANISLLDQSSVFSWLTDSGVDFVWAVIIVCGAIVAAIYLVLAWFLRTTYGLSMRAGGMDVQTARGAGVRTEARQTIGMMASAALAATTGGLLVQTQGFMDVSLQAGVVVAGLASLIIGAALVRSPRPMIAMGGVLLGVLIYRIALAWALDAGINPQYVKLVTAGIVVLIIAARNQSWMLLAPARTAIGRRRRREHLQFFEEDRVVHII